MDDIIQAIITKLETAITGWRVIYGNAPQEPDAYLPMISVSPVNTTFNVRGTGGLRDENQSIRITAIVDLKEYYQSANSTEVDHTIALVQVMESRGNDGLPEANTILGVLNNDLSITGSVGTILEFVIDYDTIPTSRYATATLTILTSRILPNNC